MYNLTHTILVWGAAFVVLWVLSGAVYLPLLGWLGHIAVDRAVGYGLRAQPSVEGSASAVGTSG